jgi:hypothetical protein
MLLPEGIGLEVAFVIDVIPVTPKVDERVVAAVTPKVPAIVVLPFDAVTTNLLELTERSPVIPTVLEKVEAPV